MFPSAVGQAIASSSRPLIYGGGSNGLMGVVAGAVIAQGGHVTGVVPYAMTFAGEEGGNTHVNLLEQGWETVSS